MNICFAGISGGHITIALSVIEILRRGGNHKIWIIGRKYKFSGDEIPSFEYTEACKADVEFISFFSGKFYRTSFIYNFFSALLMFFATFYAFFLLRKKRPDIVVSFGGYLALPICISAWILHIPVITHEQTIVAGAANRIIGIIAKKVLVSFPQAKKYFKQEKTFITGNPIRKILFSQTQPFFPVEKRRPIILVIGGSSGSHIINVYIAEILGVLLKNFTVIHQTGSASEFKDFESLNKISSPYYIVKQYLTSEEISSAYKYASFVVSRSGANTVFELIALKKPCVLVPLPHSGFNEQFLHAELLERAGVGKIFYQEKGTSELLRCIEYVFKNCGEMKKNFAKLQYLIKPEAGELIAQHIINSI